MAHLVAFGLTVGAEGEESGPLSSFHRRVVVHSGSVRPLCPAQALGVDTSRLMLVQPDCGEQALEVADQLARCGEIGMIVVDSVSALVPK